MPDRFIISFPQSPRLRPVVNGGSSPGSAFIGRQPIFDTSLAVYGYELLYRRGNDDRAVFSDRDSASAEVALDAFLEFGLDTLVGERRAFINLTRTVLLSGFCRQLPPDRVVLEVLEDVPCDDEVVREVEALAAAGYRIALDDFVAGDERSTLLPHASIVKVDIESCDESTLRRQLGGFRHDGIELVAERVETSEQLDLCRQLGFNYFQGFFFARPTTVRGRRVPVERLTALRALVLLADHDSPLSALADAVAADVKLSYQVLRVANSAYSAPASPIESIGGAILRLGRDRLSGWLSVMALSGMEGKPAEVLTLALTRAKMCEALGRATAAERPGNWFMAGLLSTLDLLFEAPLPQLLAGLPLAPAVIAAVASRTGELGEALNAVVAFERGEWTGVNCGRLTPGDFTAAYGMALRWTREWDRLAAA